MAGTSRDDRTGPYERIYRRIIEGVYRPGKRLIEQQLPVTVDAPLVFQAFRRFDRSGPERSNMSHRLLRNAIKAHDGERAARLMTEHIDQGRDVLLVGFDQVGSVEGLVESFAS